MDNVDQVSIDVILGNESPTALDVLYSHLPLMNISQIYIALVKNSTKCPLFRYLTCLTLKFIAQGGKRFGYRYCEIPFM